MRVQSLQEPEKLNLRPHMGVFVQQTLWFCASIVAPHAVSLKSPFKLSIFLLLLLKRTAAFKLLSQRKTKNVFTVPPLEQHIELVHDSRSALRG